MNSFGLFHDLGKYSSAFQNYLKSAIGRLEQDKDDDFVDPLRMKGKIDHSTAGAQTIFREFEKKRMSLYTDAIENHLGPSTKTQMHTDIKG